MEGKIAVIFDLFWRISSEEHKRTFSCEEERPPFHLSPFTFTFTEPNPTQDIITFLTQNAHSPMTNSAAVINFNIGGKRYEVSRSLFDSQSDTMLAKIASKQWQEDPESEIFIDRDGTIFRYVLNYLRDGEVKLPISERKDALIKELEFYNVDYDADKIDDSKEQTVKLIPTYQNFIRNLKDQSESAHCTYLTNCVAIYCVEQFFLQHLCGQGNKSPTSLDSENGQVGFGGFEFPAPAPAPAQPAASSDLKAIKARGAVRREHSFSFSSSSGDAVNKVIDNFSTLRLHYDEACIIQSVNSQIDALGLMVVSCEDYSNGGFGSSTSEKSLTFNMRQCRL